MPCASVHAAVEHVDAVADVHDQRDVVVDQQHARAELGVDRAHARRRRRGSPPRAAPPPARPSARSGAQRERARDAELALVAVRQEAGRILCARREAEQLEQLAAAPASVARRGAGAERRDLDVLAHGQRREQAAVLERPRQPGAAAAERRPAGDVGAAERDLARASAGRSR